jgi:hypothetical protein
VLTFQPDIDPVGFQEISCLIPTMTFTVIKHRGELLLKILVYKFVHIAYKGRMCVIMIAFSQPGVMGLKVY